MEDPGRKLQSETNLVADVKSLISVAKPKKKKFLVYSFMFAFIAFTVFFAFNPNGDSYPWINRFFTTSSENPSSYSSKLSSFFSFIFPYSHSSPFPETVSDVKNKTQSQEKKPLPTTLGMKQNGVSSNLTEKSEGKSLNGDLAKGNFTEKGKVGVLNSTSLVEGKNGFSYNLTGNGGHAILNSTSSLDNKHGSLPPNNVTEEKKGLNSSIQQHAISEKTKALNSSKSFEEKKTYSGTIALNATSSLMKKNNNINDLRKYNEEKLIASMMKCDLFHGNWVFDESYPLYPRGSCQHIDESFNCYLNGRPDRNYENLRWQPNGCSIPRLNATDMLERLRGKRLVFVGDSLNRNMWESLVCTLKNSIQDKKRVFEASGRHEFRTEGSYSFLFVDYNCSVEFFRSPFLVQEWETPETNGKTRETLRLDVIENSSHKYKDADIIVFNTGHWWTHEKTSKGQDYYQEGSHVYGQLNVVEAFRRALTTWARWVDANIDPKKTLVFFRGYSSSHFSGGQWNSGGQCDKETEPIKNKAFLSPYPPKMYALESVLKGMKTKILYLNITRMTDYRKDGHPSVYRKQHLTEEERKSPLRYQDCSHWCLPGVPDSWNELLYAQLLIKQHKQ